jgi:hypothetical protein
MLCLAREPKFIYHDTKNCIAWLFVERFVLCFDAGQTDSLVGLPSVSLPNRPESKTSFDLFTGINLATQPWQSIYTDKSSTLNNINSIPGKDAD